MTWFRVGGAGIPVSLKNGMNAVLNKKFGTSGQNYPSNGWPDDVNLLGPLPEKTVAGAIAHTDDAADTVPVKSMICSIVPKQAGSGTPSPTNPRALSGYTGLNLVRAYNNLWNGFFESGWIDNSGADSPNADRSRSGYIQVKGGLTYYFINGGFTWRIYYYDHDKTFISYIGTYTTNRSITIPDDACYIRFAVISVEPTGVSLNYPNSDTESHTPSSVLSIADSWSTIGAIYGGERDLVEGTLKKTHEYISSYNGEAINEPWISSIDEYVSGTTPSTGAQVVYPLTTPVIYSNLDTYDFETLYAVNNFFSDIVGGQTQMTYRQDIALALQALQGSRSLSASLMRSESPEEVSEPEENIQNTEEQEGENDER